MAFALFAAARTGGEYRHGTIGQRVLAAPRRARLVVAKCVTYGGLAAITARTVAAMVPVADAVASNKGVTLGFSLSDIASVTGQAVAGSMLFAILGVAVGFITRNPTSAILVVLGTFLGEQIFVDLLGPVGRYMPYELLDSLLDVGSMSPLTGGLALTALTAAIALDERCAAQGAGRLMLRKTLACAVVLVVAFAVTGCGGSAPPNADRHRLQRAGARTPRGAGGA